MYIKNHHYPNNLTFLKLKQKQTDLMALFKIIMSSANVSRILHCKYTYSASLVHLFIIYIGQVKKIHYNSVMGTLNTYNNFSSSSSSNNKFAIDKVASMISKIPSPIYKAKI